MSLFLLYEVIVARYDPDIWHVEAVDADGEGEVLVAAFSGPGAEERAREYAAWKQNKCRSQNAECRTEDRSRK